MAQLLLRMLSRTSLAGMTVRFRDGGIDIVDMLVSLERIASDSQVARLREGGDLVT